MSEQSAQPPLAHIDQALEKAAAYRRQGLNREAEEQYLAILRIEADHPEANFALGLLALEENKASESLVYFEAALDKRPDHGPYWLRYIEALDLAGQSDAARQIMEMARQAGLDGEDADALAVRLGLFTEQTIAAPSQEEADRLTDLYLQGQISDCESLARALLARFPNDGFSWKILGAVLARQNRLDEAITAMRKAVLLLPEDSEACNNLGLILKNKGLLSESESILRHALDLRDDFTEAHNNLGVTLMTQGRFSEAEECFRTSMHLQPEYVEAYCNLGICLKKQRQFADSETIFRQAIRLKPTYAEAYNNLGNLLHEIGRLAEAEAILRKAIEIKADFAVAYTNLGNVLHSQGFLQESEACLQKALDLKPDYREAYDWLLFVSNYHPDKSEDEIYQLYQEYDARFGRPLKDTWAPHGNSRNGNRRLRIGYVSPAFYRHPVFHHLLPLLANHDKSRFEIYAYAEMAREDAVTESYKQHVDHWIPTLGLSDDEMVQQIRNDEIDILVDLAGHTGMNRLTVFARKPAPISLHWLDFGYTTGLPAIDYYLTDINIAPIGSERLFSEQLWRLPVPPFAYRPAPDMGDVSPLPALERGYITFGTLTRAIRTNQRTIRVWAEILQRVDNSRLVIDSGNFKDPAIRELLIEKFVAQGIDRSRLEIGYHSPPWDVLRTIDIGLDCFPHNSGTTLFENLFMGIPFITLEDRPGVGKLGRAILKGVGHPEWIAHSELEYIEKIVTLASDLPHLATARASLRRELENSPLMDELGFAGKVEEAYQRMFKLWSEKTPSAGIDTTDLPQATEAKSPQMTEEAIALYNAGVDCHRQGKLTEAEEHYIQAINIRHDFTEAINNLGTVFQQEGQFAEAEASFAWALQIRPSYADACFNLANTYKLQQKYLKAEEQYRKVIAIVPDYVNAHYSLGNILQEQGKLDEAEGYLRRALTLNPNHQNAFSTLLFTVNYHPNKNPEEIFEEYREYNRRFCLPHHSAWAPHANSRRKNRPLRVGYVASDYRKHPSRYFLEPLLAHHDRNSFETFAYVELSPEERETDLFQGYVDHWRPTAGLTDDSLCQLIVSDAIDILVDLAGHTAGNRLGVFARKPAPVSLHWLDFGYTTGLTAIDYYLTDATSVPTGGERYFSEIPWRLKTPALAYRPPPGIGPVNDLPALKNGYLTFGTLTRAVRINHRTVRVWAEILKRCKNSRLIVNSGSFADPVMQEALADQFILHGIERDRLDIGSQSPPWDILRRMDIGLDCFPHNSGTTLIESLYMGVPYITLADRPSVGRLGSSILVSVGHPEWIAETEDGYIANALTLAADIPRLAAIRKGLREEMARSPLMDEAGFARKVETAYREMFNRWCNVGPMTAESDDTEPLSKKANKRGKGKLSKGHDKKPLPGELPEADGQKLIHLFNQGNHTAALELARSLTTRFPDYGIGWKVLGPLLHQAGLAEEALQAMQQAALILSDDADAQYNLGIAQHQAGLLPEAENSYRKALHLNREHAQAQYNLATVLQATGNMAAAENCLRQVLSVKPDYFEAHCNLGNLLKSQGRFSESIDSFQAALRIRPDSAEVLINLSLALYEQGLFSEAEIRCREALRGKPDSPEAHNNLGLILQQSGQVKEAEASYRKALTHKPDYSPAYNNLGYLLQKQGRLAEAEDSFRQALRFSPQFKEAYRGLAILQQKQGRLIEAEDNNRKALALQPDDVKTLNNLAATLYKQGRNSEAETICRRALALDADYPKAYNNLNNILVQQGQFDQAEQCLRRALALRPDFIEARSNLLFLLNYSPDKTAEEIFEEYRNFNRDFALPLQVEQKTCTNNRLVNRRLKVGYVAPQLYRHSSRHFLEPLLAHHDREKVEVFAYAELLREDQQTERYKTLVDHWRVTTGMSDAEVAERIRLDAIDILIDLAGHTDGNRLGVFARKPAPVSLHWLDFGYTTGLSAIDYYLADPMVVPIGSEHLFAEKPWRLTTPCIVYRPAENMGDVSSLPAATHGYVTFGTLTRAARINHRTIRVWAEILRQIEGSHLVIDSGDFKDPQLVAALAYKFGALGIDRERLEIGFHSPPWDTLRGIDICFDCFPHNSGTTLIETLYMGIPYVTKADRPSVGRLGSCILEGVGHPEWIAQTEDEYIALAVALATDLPKLANIRSLLRQEMQGSPLMDQPLFAKKVEAAYREMFALWCEKQGPSTEAASATATAISPQAVLDEAEILFQAGQFQEAEKIYRKAIADNQDFAELHYALANTLVQLERIDEAETQYRVALKLKPDFAEVLGNLGNILQRLGRGGEAEECYHRALTAKPGFIEAYFNLGNLLRNQNRLSDAVAQYHQAIRLRPDYYKAHSNLGITLQMMGHLAEAEKCYRTAISIQPDFVEGHINLGACLKEQGLYREAEKCYRNALTLYPDFALCHSNLGSVLKEHGLLDEAELSLRRALQLNPDSPEIHSNLLFLLNYHPDKTAEEIFEEYRAFDSRFCRPLQARWQAFTNTCRGSRRLRIGYVSPQLRLHSIRHFLEPLLAHHDKEHFEIFAYAEVAVEDQVSGRYQSYVDHWLNTTGMSDEALAERIRTDRIDILVELAGHTVNNRLLMFARKPAPVSLHWLDFGYTTGVSAIDYYLADPALAPNGSEGLFAERPWRLETPSFAYRPAEGMGEVNPLPAATRGYVTFGTLTRAVRINHRTIRVWSEILKRVEDARLVIDSNNFRDPAMQEELADKFAAYGIARERLTIGFNSPPWDVLRSMDVHLDCFPHNSGTTLFETLYMGVPFITLAGRPSVGRLGCSILEGIGHPEWIARTEEEYIDLAVRLAADFGKMANLRASLRAEMERGPLMDEQTFARKVERAYSEMFARWCENNAPSPLENDGKTSQSLDVEHILDEAEGLFRAGRMQEAESLYLSVVEGDPHNPAANYQMGCIAVARGQFPAALPYFAAATEACPEHGPYWLAYIDALDRAGQSESARQLLEMAIQAGLDGEEAVFLQDRLLPAVSEIPEAAQHLPKGEKIKRKKKNKVDNSGKNRAATPNPEDTEKLVALFQQGKLNEAEVLATSLVEHFPRAGQAWKILGAIRRQQGFFNEALTAMLQSAKVMPDDYSCLRNIAVVLCDLERYQEAESYCRKALAMKTDYADAHNTISIALRCQKRLAEAERSCLKAMHLRPDNLEILVNFALILNEEGKFSDAETSFRKALTINPNFAEALCGLSLTLLATDRLVEAETVCRQAIAIKPAYFAAYNALGSILHQHERYSEAETAYRRALELKPLYPEAVHNLGKTLHKENNFSAAEACYRQVLQLMPNDAEACYHLGNSLQDQGRHSEAEEAYKKAVHIKPEYIEARINLGNALREQGWIIEAEKSYRDALKIDPDYKKAFNNLGNILQEQGRLEEAEVYFRAVLAAEPDFVEAYGNLLFLLNYHPEKSAEEIFLEYKKFDEHFGKPLQASWRPHANSRNKNRRLKVGYVSPQFCKHPVCNFLEPLLAWHNKDLFELYAYAEMHKEDAVTERYRTYIEHWLPTKGMTDERLAERIREDEIDILVDLAGHTGRNRLLVFARRPAPVSLHWLDFGYTTGLTAIDYYLSDTASLPAGSDGLFAEKPWRLAPPTVVYRPTEGMGEVNALPAGERGYVTFGSLSRAVRINHKTIRVWAEILKRVKGSHLLINSGNFKDRGMQERFAEKFQAHGIDRDRLQIGCTSPPWDVLRDMDIGLDCFPHNSGTTLIESLYMGIPFITLAGRPSVGRLGCSVLEGAGHPELVAQTEEEYIELAVSLAADQTRLARLRASLRPEMEKSPLMDEPAFARKVEAAYQEMFTKWCEEQR
jgi:predicted O-linked N-acetylglucosamine transferase (SPINDLY family)